MSFTDKQSKRNGTLLKPNNKIETNGHVKTRGALSKSEIELDNKPEYVSV